MGITTTLFIALKIAKLGSTIDISRKYIGYRNDGASFNKEIRADKYSTIHYIAAASISVEGPAASLCIQPCKIQIRTL